MEGIIKSAFVYSDDKAARGCGHTGFVFFYDNGVSERIYQSAANTGYAVWKLVLLKHKMVVVVDEFKKPKRIRQLIGKARYFKLRTAHAQEIRSRIDEYIRQNRPYSSLTNNCAHFMHFALGAAPDVRSKARIIPKRYFRLLRKLNGSD